MDSERETRAMVQAAQFLDDMADTLDMWARSSRDGGWSTHQIGANLRKAHECRREAAYLRMTVDRPSPMQGG